MTCLKWVRPFPAFRALVDGYVRPDQADAHLQFFNKQQQQGIDLGLHADMMDSVIQMNLYPEQPIVGFRKFSLNPDNYIQMRMKPSHREGVPPEVNCILADVSLRSLSDSCVIVLSASCFSCLL